MVHSTLADSFKKEPYSRPVKSINELAGYIYGLSPPTNIIGFGAKLFSDRKGILSPTPLLPVQIDRLPQAWTTLEYHRINRAQVQYWALNPLKNDNFTLRKGPLEHYENHLQNSCDKPLYFRKGQDSTAGIGTVWLDLDIGRPGEPTAQDARAGMVELARAGRIPWPSLTAYSGRGCYAVWLTHDDDNPEALAPASPDNRTRYHALIDGLSERLQAFAPDVGRSKDFSGWSKRPGATCDKTGQVVEYSRWFPAETPRRYSLATLLDSLGLPTAPSAPRASTRKPAPFIPWKRDPDKPVTIPKVPPVDGHQVPHGAEPVAARLRDLHRLLPYVSVGIRNFYLLAYANAVYRWHRHLDASAPKSTAKSTAAEATRAINQRLAQPVRVARVEDVTARPGRPRLNKTRTVVSWLGITPEVAECYQLETLFPRGFNTTAVRADLDRKRSKAQLQAQVDAALLATGKAKARPSEIARRFGVSRQYVYDRGIRLQKLASKP